ncbi:hypothetical protein [Flavobacterium dankookense]|uniref:Response receiver domain-containing protein n=1 Tax=Flavobacterium dankookense TaxID=706186 RepID=A0A4R6QB83_9FLAO|nr:hypothetical protein [Flavobacterium dankookense]TDP59944.1 hypothetical protein BC748_0914 [Flavobacterium dankookense]
MINFLEPNVIIIDDKREEIQGIYDYYVAKGIGCKVFNPDLIYGDDYPQKTYSDTNIIFLDLHYSEQFDAEICSTWIRHIVKPRSFYILVMWSKDVSKAEQVSELLRTHMVIPFITLIKSKTDYQVEQGYNFSELFEQLNTDLNSTHSLEEILHWKKTVKYSSNEIIGNLTKTPNNVVNKLKKIIIAHGGTSIKESEDNIYKRSILFDALDTVLISNTKKNIDGEISELNNQNLYNLQDVEDSTTDKELNSWFHFKLGNEISPSLITPGLIAINNHSFFKKLYSIKDDSKIEVFLKKQIEDGRQIEDIVLLISRPCDIAQKKYGKNLKLLSGLIIKNPVRKTNGKLDIPTPMDSIKIYDHLYFDENDNDVTLLFDFRYSFSVPFDIFINKFRNVKIFNKELLSEMQVEYSSYSSRLGITQII